MSINYVNISLEEFNSILDEINQDSNDRSLCLLSGSLLDNLLYSLISNSIVYQEEDKPKELVGVDQLIGSFGKKINVSFAFGLISQTEYTELKAILEIRNLAAHSIGLKEGQRLGFDELDTIKKFKAKVFPQCQINNLALEERRKFQERINSLYTKETFREILTHVVFKNALSLFSRIGSTKRLTVPNEIG